MPRTNPTAPTVALTIDGETYKLFFSLDVIAEAEEITDKPLITGLNRKDFQSPRVSLIRALFWASLRVHHPEVTLEQVKALITVRNLGEVWEKVLDAWVACMKGPDEDGANPPKGQS